MKLIDTYRWNKKYIDVPVKKLISKNYKRFTFDLVLWRKWKLNFDRSYWTFNIGEGPKQHTYRIRLGRLHFTFWWKNDV